MTPNRSDSADKGAPWPEYFIVRTTREVVPLIAVDELPVGIKLEGVPRSISIEQTTGMINMGVHPSAGGHYKIVSDQVLNEEHGKSAANTKIHNMPPSTRKATLVASTLSPDSTPPASPRASNTMQPEPFNVRCRHWCHHGVCKWDHQCKYSHSMPMTLRGLQEVGLTDWPSWFRKMNPGYFVNESPVTVNRTRMRVCGAGPGHGGASCGALHAGRPERRIVGHRGLRERIVGRPSESEALGDQIHARLRAMAREVSSAGEKGNAMVEKAAARVTRNWEDESEGSNDGNAEREEFGENKGNLVDV